LEATTHRNREERRWLLISTDARTILGLLVAAFVLMENDAGPYLN
jgi:hypothetical protein